MNDELTIIFAIGVFGLIFFLLLKSFFEEKKEIQESFKCCDCNKTWNCDNCVKAEPLSPKQSNKKIARKLIGYENTEQEYAKQESSFSFLSVFVDIAKFTVSLFVDVIRSFTYSEKRENKIAREKAYSEYKRSEEICNATFGGVLKAKKEEPVYLENSYEEPKLVVVKQAKPLSIREQILSLDVIPENVTVARKQYQKRLLQEKVTKRLLTKNGFTIET